MISRTRLANSSGRPGRGEGDLVGERAADFVGGGGHHRRVEHARRDRDDADAEAGQFASGGQA